MEKIKGLWISDMVVPTGFSRVTHSILRHIDKKRFDVTGLGVNYRGDPHPYQLRIYPASLGGDVYGINRLEDILKSEKFDFIYILNDSWIINKYLATLKSIGEKMPLPRIITYFPVDSEEHDPDWYNNFDIVSKAVTYTKFGYDVIKKIYPNMDLEVVPHGVDTEIFYKKFPSRAEAKVNLFTKNVDLKDSFIILNANRNQPRKRLDITMEAFAKFSKDKPINTKLYMHCGIRDAAVDISKLSARYKIQDRLIVTSIKTGVQAVPDDRLNDIYNACDVGINTSMGEGWGLTPIEHAITGAPQIIPEHSACIEVFGGCGVFVKPITNFTFDHVMTVGKLVSVDDVADRMQLLYEDEMLRDELAQASINKFSSPEYSWKNIAKTWEKLIKEAIE